MFWKKKKSKKSEFKCSECGNIHLEWPALVFNSPDNYYNLSDSEKLEIGKLDTDFCEIHYENQVDRFVRVVLIKKLNDACEMLEYGLWVSLSEKSYSDYLVNYNNSNHETGYFGWISNNIFEYADMSTISCNVITKSGNDRPEIFPHEDFDHQFVKDFYNGITKKEAIRRVNDMLRNTK
tara:strand:- start:332 stop:868 length:537 start_codon:yes stop_codon:yes gene_type:complete